MGNNDSDVGAADSLAELNSQYRFDPSSPNAPWKEEKPSSCSWEDATEYSVRLRQLEIINHAILELSSRLWATKDYTTEDWSELIDATMTYTNAFGQPDPQNHPWTLLTSDPNPLFIVHEQPGQNVFGRFAVFKRDYYGADNTQRTLACKEILSEFADVRDRLVQSMQNSCQ